MLLEVWVHLHIFLYFAIFYLSNHVLIGIELKFCYNYNTTISITVCFQPPNQFHLPLPQPSQGMLASPLKLSPIIFFVNCSKTSQFYLANFLKRGALIFHSPNKRFHSYPQILPITSRPKTSSLSGLRGGVHIFFGACGKRVNGMVPYFEIHYFRYIHHFGDCDGKWFYYNLVTKSLGVSIGVCYPHCITMIFFRIPILSLPQYLTYFKLSRVCFFCCAIYLRTVPTPTRPFLPLPGRRGPPPVGWRAPEAPHSRLFSRMSSQILILFFCLYPLPVKGVKPTNVTRLLSTCL